jgi:hypothetical protein
MQQKASLVGNSRNLSEELSNSHYRPSLKKKVFIGEEYFD